MAPFGPVWTTYRTPMPSFLSHMAPFCPIWPLLVFIWLPKAHLPPYGLYWGPFGLSCTLLGPIWPLIQTKWVPMAKWAILISCDPFWHNRGTIRVNKLPCVAIMRPFGSIGSHIGPLGNDIKNRGGHIGTKWVIVGVLVVHTLAKGL